MKGAVATARSKMNRMILRTYVHNHRRGVRISYYKEGARRLPECIINNNYSKLLPTLSYSVSLLAQTRNEYTTIFFDSYTMNIDYTLTSPC